MLDALRMMIFMALVIPAAALAKPPDVTIAAHSGPVLDVAFSKDATKLASAGDDGKLKLWDVASGKELWTCDGIRSTDNNIRLTPDGKNVIAIGSENNVAVIDAATGKLARSIPLPDLSGGAAALDLSPDGATIAVVGRGKIRILNIAGVTKAEWAVHAGYGVTAVAFSADGATIATAGTDNTAVISQVATGKILQTLKLRLNGVAVSFSLNGKTLFVSASDRSVQSIDLAAGTAKLLVDKGMPIFKLMVSADGKTLVMAGLGHGPWLVTLPDETLADPTFDSEEWVKSAAMSKDGHWFAGGGNGGSVFLWKNEK